MAVVEVKNLVKYFGQMLAVDDISIKVDSGEFVSLLGPSGCGKTTTLRMIAGLMEPDGGDVVIGSEKVNDKPIHKRNIGMVFQSYALFPHMTVGDNVGFGLKMRGLGKTEIAQRVKEALALIRLPDTAGRYPRQLSGGQQQRIALARAIVIRPEVLLLDEPLSNLDAKLRHEMRREIRMLQQRLGITMVYVTHDQVEAMTMADKIALLYAGHIEQFAPPDALYARPATLFAAGFIGTPPMNLLPLNEPEAAGWARSHSVGAFPEGPLEELVLGVRPEKISLADSGLSADVLSLEYLGADTLIACKVGAREWIVRQDGKIRLAAGERIHLTWPAAENHWFEANSEKRRDI